MPSFWNCPKPAGDYKSEHEITEQEFNDRSPAYLTRHLAPYVAEKVGAIANCETPVGVNPAGEIVLAAAAGLVYYPAGLFKALLASHTEIFEMFATDETGPLGRPDVIMKTSPKAGRSFFYDMSEH